MQIITELKKKKKKAPSRVNMVTVSRNNVCLIDCVFLCILSAAFGILWLDLDLGVRVNYISKLLTFLHHIFLAFFKFIYIYIYLYISRVFYILVSSDKKHAIKLFIFLYVYRDRCEKLFDTKRFEVCSPVLYICITIYIL